MRDWMRSFKRCETLIAARIDTTVRSLAGAALTAAVSLTFISIDFGPKLVRGRTRKASSGRVTPHIGQNIADEAGLSLQGWIAAAASATCIQGGGRISKFALP